MGTPVRARDAASNSSSPFAAENSDSAIPPSFLPFCVVAVGASHITGSICVPLDEVNTTPSVSATRPLSSFCPFMASRTTGVRSSTLMDT